ncbi:hypothetical protein JTE90_015243 [Oedothorax gibbosus]|uniref:DUF5577 domain-containing protein n=1 Tax=Oedothorax gibbosus TaxID=931172 RepID=A0AAV6U0R5_9ARAC|nr:hypothetical protein JTE90_015243 [Oedothorax gibbosus]
MDTSQWIAFFRKAGLPPNVAANYAIIFFDNRIQVDMLLDLSKEYLYDMGIKVMGDVIAILKYAKEFNNQLAKERIIGVQPVPTTKAVAERFVGHYTRSSPLRTQGPIERASLKRKSNIISLKPCTPPLPSPFSKPRRVPPEEEGAYKIKMPQGTTERTRKILRLQKMQQIPQAQAASKRSVFSRLGESAVSSSTDLDKPSSSTVFERLGPAGRSDETPSSTVMNEITMKPKGKPLPYRGVLKMTVGKNRVVTTTVPKNASILSRTVIKPAGLGNQRVIKTVQLNRINSTLRTNRSPKAGHVVINTKKPVKSQSLFGAAISQSVKSRLGEKIDARNPARTKILLKNRLQLKSQSNVFDRLGR